MTFETQEERDAVYAKVLEYVPRSCKTETTDVSVYTYQWVHGQLSTFEYLSLINTYAQRSTQDMTQYPVFPWIIKDYDSEVLDLEDVENTYRDLSKPIGAMTQKRLDDYLSRY